MRFGTALAGENSSSIRFSAVAPRSSPARRRTGSSRASRSPPGTSMWRSPGGSAGAAARPSTNRRATPSQSLPNFGLRGRPMSENEGHDVGYGKPPKATQWKPGQSGNPKGRPKRTKDVEKLLDLELSKPIRITDGGQAVTMTKREVLIKTVVHDALKGDRDALKLVFSFMKSQLAIEGFEPDA